MKKRYIIMGIIILLALSILFAPKILGKGDKRVKYKALESTEIPEKIKEALPKYLMEERALVCRLNDEIYVLVTRGEKQTGGYFVNVDKIVVEQRTKEEFDLIVYAMYRDPNAGDIVTQGFTYPFAIVKTNLNKMPSNINLEIIHEE